MSDVELKAHHDEKVNEAFQIFNCDKQGSLPMGPGGMRDCQLKSTETTFRVGLICLSPILFSLPSFIEV